MCYDKRDILALLLVLSAPSAVSFISAKNAEFAYDCAVTNELIAVLLEY